MRGFIEVYKDKSDEGILQTKILIRAKDIVAIEEDQYEDGCSILIQSEVGGASDTIDVEERYESVLEKLQYALQQEQY